MNKLFYLADFVSPGPNGEPPGMVFLIVGIFIFLIVVLPIVSVVSQLKQNQKKAEADKIAQRNRVRSDDSQIPVSTSVADAKAKYDNRDDVRQRLATGLSKVSPEIGKRLDEQKKARELRQTTDTLTGTIKPHNHENSSADKGLDGSIDYCEFDDFFEKSAITSQSDEEVEALIDLDFSEEGMRLDYAAEYIIFGDIINNPKSKKTKP